MYQDGDPVDRGNLKINRGQGKSDMSARYAVIRSTACGITVGFTARFVTRFTLLLCRNLRGQRDFGSGLHCGWYVQGSTGHQVFHTDTRRIVTRLVPGKPRQQGQPGSGSEKFFNVQNVPAMNLHKACIPINGCVTEIFQHHDYRTNSDFIPGDDFTATL